MVKNMSNFDIYLTFDLDYVDHTDSLKNVNEFEILENMILPYLENKDIKATWFVRLDKKIENDFGLPDFLCINHKETIDKLKKLGHTIAWHPHNYLFENGKWLQNTHEESILEELNYLLPFVKKYDFDIVRVGWGFQTNKTMKFFSENGFKIDSTCMARPKYTWDITVKDWSISSNLPFFPSEDDYRIEKDKNLKVLEVPMTTVDIPVTSDTELVKRYINFSFYSSLLKEPLKKWIDHNDFLVSITHPYEIFRSKNPHHIISFDIDEFKKNIEFLNKNIAKKNMRIKYKTLDEFLND